MLEGDQMSLRNRVVNVEWSILEIENIMLNWNGESLPTHKKFWCGSYQIECDVIVNEHIRKW